LVFVVAFAFAFALAFALAVALAPEIGPGFTPDKMTHPTNGLQPLGHLRLRYSLEATTKHR
jgi:hypothetical protein